MSRILSGDSLVLCTLLTEEMEIRNSECRCAAVYVQVMYLGASSISPHTSPPFLRDRISRLANIRCGAIFHARKTATCYRTNELFYRWYVRGVSPNVFVLLCIEFFMGWCEHRAAARACWSFWHSFIIRERQIWGRGSHVAIVTSIREPLINHSSPSERSFATEVTHHALRKRYGIDISPQTRGPRDIPGADIQKENLDNHGWQIPVPF
ncbi:hypothetical protein GGR54DRAFT_94630 [Hypoxylon sp. NC1633]|nr:hypothetical protein GGR54DRAFT_94630 [Hypoxylon sp. NC1633]